MDDSLTYILSIIKTDGTIFGLLLYLIIKISPFFSRLLTILDIYIETKKEELEKIKINR